MCAHQVLAADEADVIINRGNTWSRIARVAAAVAAVGSVALLTSCGDDGSTAIGTIGSVQTSGATSPAGVTLVDPTQGSKILDQQAAITVIDVRTPTEFAAGHLAGAKNLDVNGPTFADGIAALDPDAVYFVYCHSGRRSAVATQAMSDKGFRHVYELDGGIEAWLAAGRAVVTN